MSTLLAVIGAELFAPYSSSIPTMDGVLTPGEWDDASIADISDTLAADSSPDAPGSCLLYTMHDEAFLYIALDCPGDTDSTVFAQFNAFFDDDNSGSWPPVDTSEGGNALSLRDGWMTAWFLEDYTWSGWYLVSMNSYSISCVSGHAIAEWSIPLLHEASDLGPEYLGVDTGYTWDTLGFHTSYYHQDTSNPYIAYWPQDFSGPFYDPSGYGDLILLPGSGNRESEAGFGSSLVAVSTGRGLHLILQVSEAGPVDLSVFDPAGRVVARFRQYLPAGKHQLDLSVPGPGVFFVEARVAGRRLEASAFVP